MKQKTWPAVLSLLVIMGLPAWAEEKQVVLNKDNSFRASFNEAIANAKEGNTYVVSLADAVMGMLEIDIAHQIGNFRPQIVITDKDRKKLAQTVAASRGGNISDYQVRVGTGKQYFVTVKNLTGAVVTSPFAIDFKMNPVPNPHAPNQDFANAKLLSLGEEVQVTMFAPIEETYDNYFTFVLDADSTLMIAMPGLAEMRPQITIYDQHKKKVKETTVANRGADLNAEAALQGGTYFVRLRDLNQKSSVVPFRLLINKK